jgi:hypothetical protein
LVLAMRILSLVRPVSADSKPISLAIPLII